MPCLVGYTLPKCSPPIESHSPAGVIECIKKISILLRHMRFEIEIYSFEIVIVAFKQIVDS